MTELPSIWGGLGCSRSSPGTGPPISPADGHLSHLSSTYPHPAYPLPLIVIISIDYLGQPVMCRSIGMAFPWISAKLSCKRAVFGMVVLLKAHSLANISRSSLQTNLGNGMKLIEQICSRHFSKFRQTLSSFSLFYEDSSSFKSYG